MKNKIYAFLIGIMLVSTLFTGCGQNNEPSTDSKSEAENTDGSSVTESEADDTQNDLQLVEVVKIGEFVKVNCMGYSGVGYVTLDVNYDAINEIVSTEDVQTLLKKYPKLNEFYPEEFKTFSDLFQFKYPEETNLSNKDSIEVVISVDNRVLAMSDGVVLDDMENVWGIKIEKETLVVKPQFEEIPVIDLPFVFQDNVIFAGTNGYGTARLNLNNAWQIDNLYLVGDGSSIEIICNNKRISVLSYHNDANGTLSTGDEVIFTLHYDESYSDLLNMGYRFPEELKMEVPVLGEYISSPEQVTDEFRQVISEDLERGNWGRSVELQGVYFGTIKPTVVVNDIVKEKHCIAVSYKNYGEIYWAYYYEVVLKPDGTYGFERGAWDFPSNNYAWELVWQK